MKSILKIWMSENEVENKVLFLPLKYKMLKPKRAPHVGKITQPKIYSYIGL